MATIQLKPKKAIHLLRGHPWIYPQAIAKITGHYQPGDTVQVVDEFDKFVAKAAISPTSAIRARVWHDQENRPVDDAFFKQQVSKAIRLRQELIDPSTTNAYRIIFGEADGLPGFIADLYADTIVCQITSCGAEKWRNSIVNALVQQTGATAVYERSDSAVREKEGLPKRTGWLIGSRDSTRVQIIENGIRYWVDIASGHKTGFYLDQRENRALTTKLAHQRTVLNCFCYTGGFSLAAIKGGSQSVLSIDSSGEALALAKENLALNEFKASTDSSLQQMDPNLVEWHDGDVMESLKSLANHSKKFDLIILDPPKFAPSQQHLDRAVHAYRELNHAGMKLLSPGGHLLTFSCSGAMTAEHFRFILTAAGQQQGQHHQIIKHLSAGPDHPSLPHFTEGDYLKGFWLYKPYP